MVFAGPSAFCDALCNCQPGINSNWVSLCLTRYLQSNFWQRFSISCRIMTCDASNLHVWPLLLAPWGWWSIVEWAHGKFSDSARTSTWFTPSRDFPWVCSPLLDDPIDWISPLLGYNLGTTVHTQPTIQHNDWQWPGAHGQMHQALRKCQILRNAFHGLCCVCFCAVACRCILCLLPKSSWITLGTWSAKKLQSMHVDLTRWQVGQPLYLHRCNRTEFRRWGAVDAKSRSW